MRHTRLKIKQKIHLSFLLVLTIVFTGEIYTLMQLNKSRKVVEELATVYEPSLVALKEMSELVYQSKLLIKNWVYVDYKENTPDKQALQELHKEQYPAAKNRMTPLIHFWPDSISQQYFYTQSLIEEKLFPFHQDIMTKLQHFEDYDNPMIIFSITPLVQDEQSEVMQLTTHILEHLNKIEHVMSQKFSTEEVIMRENLARFSRELIITGLLLITLLFIISRVTIHSITRPIQKLIKGTQILGQGDLSHRVSITSGDEMEYMGKAFNNMAANIQNNQNNLVKLNNMLRTSEQELKKSNQTKDKFFSIIAHDLKGPLNALTIVTEALMTHHEALSESRKQQFIQNAHRSALSLHQLVINLLDWARTQSKKIDFNPQWLNLHALISEIATLYQQPCIQRKLILQYNIDKELKVWADHNILLTILRNIVSNAVKYSPDGGTITLEVIDDEQKTTLKISDQGTGLTPEEIKKLFRPDIDTRSIGNTTLKGTGLGLILCHEFVALHHGDIQFNSTPGQGSVVTFTLPKAAKAL